MSLIQLPSPDLTPLLTQYTVRSPGVHQSDISKLILSTLDPDRFSSKGGPNQRNLLMGMIFERLIENLWLDMTISSGARPELIRPGELTLDGVKITPDAYNTGSPILPPGEGCPCEFKATKNSCRQSILDSKFWHYWAQLKCQASASHSRFGELWVLFINGNYSRDYDDPDAGYTIKGWLREFTPIELEENWEMHLRHIPFLPEELRNP